MRRGGVAGARSEVHEAEAARVVVDDRLAAGEMEQDMVVQAAPVARVVEDARRRGARRALDAEGTGHAEMHDDARAVVEIGEEIFGAPSEPLDPAALEPRGEAFWKGKAEVGPAQFERLDPRPLHHRAEAEADGFDFGQFGHGVAPLIRVPRRHGARGTLRLSRASKARKPLVPVRKPSVI